VEVTRLLGHDLKYALASAGRVLTNLGRLPGAGEANEPYVADLRHALAEIDRAADVLLKSEPPASATHRAIDIDGFLVQLEPSLRQVLAGDVSLSVPRTRVGRQVHASAEDLDRIIRTLVFAAAEGMPKGGDVTITTGWLDYVTTTRPRDATWSRRYVRISVADTGPGRRTETRQRVLASTTPGATSDHTAGVATMVGRLGGYMIVECAENEGSRAHVCLPAAHAVWETLELSADNAGVSPIG